MSDKFANNIILISVIKKHGIGQLSRDMRKPAFCICENRDAADQRLCIR